MRKVLKKNIILYKPLFQVIIAGPVGVTLQAGNPQQFCWGFFIVPMRKACFLA